MYFDNDISRDLGFDCGLEGLQEGRDRGNSFVYILGTANEDELPDLNSDMPFDDVFRYLQNSSYGYTSDPSTATNLEDAMNDGIVFTSSPLHPKVVRSEDRPHQFYFQTPQPPRQIGNLTPEERFNKIKRYKEKRERRVWSKKINYGCRKRVADNRLRIKGRFVTKEQAKALSSCEITSSP